MIWKERSKPVTKVEVVQAAAPMVFISRKAADKMRLIIDKSKDEVGWLCSVDEIDGGYVLQDVFIIDQEVHGATTELTAEGLQKFGEELMVMEGGMDLWTRIKGWGHSHVNMGVTPSGQDKMQMEMLIENNCDFFIRLIGNKRGELEIGVFNYKLGVSYLNVPWQVLDDKYVMEIEEKIAELYLLIDEYNLEEGEKYSGDIDAELLAKVKPIGYANRTNPNMWSSGKANNYHQQSLPVINEKKTTGPSGTSETTDDAREVVVMDYNWVNTYISEDDMVEIGSKVNIFEVKASLNEHFPGWGETLHESIRTVCVQAYEEWQMLRLMDLEDERIGALHV